MNFRLKQCAFQLVKLSMKNENKHSLWRGLARIALGGFLAFTGIGHLTFLRKEFLAQVPDWVPLNPDLVAGMVFGVYFPELKKSGALWFDFKD